jgi:hypothetical protein
MQNLPQLLEKKRSGCSSVVRATYSQALTTLVQRIKELGFAEDIHADRPRRPVPWQYSTFQPLEAIIEVPVPAIKG